MKAYAIKDPKGKIVHDTIRKKKKESMKHIEFMHFNHILYSWRNLYRVGYRCVPVVITEVKLKDKCKHLNTRSGHTPFVACICNDCGQEI